MLIRSQQRVVYDRGIRFGIAVRGDVLKYINLLQRVDFVMKGGVVYKQDGRAVER